MDQGRARKGHQHTILIVVTTKQQFVNAKLF